MSPCAWAQARARHGFEPRFPAGGSFRFIQSLESCSTPKMSKGMISDRGAHRHEAGIGTETSSVIAVESVSSNSKLMPTTKRQRIWLSSLEGFMAYFGHG